MLEGSPMDEFSCALSDACIGRLTLSERRAMAERCDIRSCRVDVFASPIPMEATSMRVLSNLR